MTLDDEVIPPKVSEAILRDFPLPKRRHPVNLSDEKDRALEVIAEQIAIAKDHLAQLEHEYARLCSITVEHDPDPSTRPRPGIDGRLFDALSADVAEEWRSPEDRAERLIVNVETSRV